MTDYVRLNTDYDTINLYNIDSRNKGDFTSYRNMNNIACDTSANLFEEFGHFSKYFICKEHAPDTYTESTHYNADNMIKQPNCPTCNNITTTLGDHTEKIIQKKVKREVIISNNFAFNRFY